MKKDHPTQLPLARTENLIIKTVEDDEVLVYDTNIDQAHCLNRTVALVWRKCDGHNSIEAIVESLEAALNTPVDERIVRLALDELAKFKLLEDQVPASPFLPQVSRREVIRALGVATITLPAIVTIVAPRPVDAATPCNAGQGCSSPADCCTAHPTCVTTGPPSGRGCRP